MQYRIETVYNPEANDPEANDVLQEAAHLGIASIDSIHSVKVYIIDGRIADREIRDLAEKLFVDPILQQYRIYPGDDVHWDWMESGEFHSIEITRKQGVMDPVKQSALKGAADLGMGQQVESVRTARKYMLKGDINTSDIEKLAYKALANTTIEEVYIDKDDVEYPLKNLKYEFDLQKVPLLKAGPAELEKISREGMLSLTLDEMEGIQAYFHDRGREPTDLELEILAQTWSEHCVHKTLKGHVTYDGPIPRGWDDYTDEDGRLIIDNLLRHTVARATHELDKPWCLSVFEDNAGVIGFDKDNALCFKVETHNHPSAIEPYGGANTGIGGVIRDPLGTGLGAKPIFNTDVFCFGPVDMPEEDVPPGALHPKRVMQGVVAGVRDYGNRMGIPTGNGAVYFDKRYTGNCLVFCGNVGIMPRDKIKKAPEPGDYVLVVGGRTGRDGIHGATFSSIELNSESEEVSGSAVQIGNPITEKKVVDTVLQARDMGLYDCITDCGAGGLSSAVGEMGEKTGVDAEISDVPLKYAGLSYTEIWISEAQERMVLSVPPQNLEKILDVFQAEDVEATVIGRFTDDEVLRVRYEGNLVAELEMEFLHEGLPGFKEKAVWQPKNHKDPLLDDSDVDGECPVFARCGSETQSLNYEEVLKKILAAPNVRSKEWIIRQYDHEVQGRTVIKPLVGVERDGPGDAAVITPVLGSYRGAAIACGMNPKYGDIDAYHAAAGAIDEALRNIIAVGGDLSQTAILDNFCWGNTRKPEQLGTLVRAALACYDYASAFGVPFISGKDSLNNEFNTGEETVSIPPTLLISAISVIEDVRHTQTMDLKSADALIYLLGDTLPELGGSHYYDLLGIKGRSVPQVNAEKSVKTMKAVQEAINSGRVNACHDLSEGGLAAAAAEMAFSGGFGLHIELSGVRFEGDARLKNNDVLLFSESNSRFLVEVAPGNEEQFERIMSEVSFSRIGRTNSSSFLTINGTDGKNIIKSSYNGLKEAWQTPF